MVYLYLRLGKTIYRFSTNTDTVYELMIYFSSIDLDSQ